MSNTLKLSDINKTYAGGVKALDNISLELTNGMFGLLGPNGAGKSTLMRAIAGLQAPDSGSIFFNGADTLADPLYIKRRLGYLPQDFDVYPGISALDLLDHLAVLKGILDKNERKEQISALLDQTNLYAHRRKAVSAYSGGMRQRFGIAQALLGAPQIIIVDEPTAGLDPEERKRFNNLLSEIGEQKIVILSTHLVEDVQNLCTRMAVIRQGRLVACGAPQDFVSALDGRIWSKSIEKNELADYQSRYKVISTQLSAGRLLARVYAETAPDAGFSSRQADLEDVYFHLLEPSAA